jgi:hypothetical protein
MYLSYDRSDYFGGVVHADPDDKIGLRNHIAFSGGRVSIAHLCLRNDAPATPRAPSTSSCCRR